MRDITWYFVLRLLFGAGVLVALGAGIVIHEGPAQVAEDLNEPMTTMDLIAFALGIPLGLLLDMVFASAIASYIVWGEVHLGGPPLYPPQPRPMFA